MRQSHDCCRNTTHRRSRRGCSLLTRQYSSKLHLIYERTIRTPAECSGVGLHSGAPVHLRILPAPAGTGIVFRRTDLDGFEVEAISRNVAKVSYATSLMKKGVLISTTEHLLSAFIGMGVDNAIVELDNLELPILDGSALPFVEMITERGPAPAAPQARLPEDPAALRNARRRQVHRRLSRRPLLGQLRHRLSASADRQRALPGRALQRQLRRADRRRPHLRLPRTAARHAEHGPDPRRLARELHRAHRAMASTIRRCAIPTSSCATRCST